jgi:hypothetical protein
VCCIRKKEKRPGVLILNYGAHYYDLDKYRNKTDALIDFLKVGGGLYFTDY